jgi:hypothetical protein
MGHGSTGFNLQSPTARTPPGKGLELGSATTL